jgi:hypothetical protein
MIKRIVLTVFFLTAALFFNTGAQACFFADKEYIVVFRPGVSWEEATAEVRGWGSSYHLATITSREEKRELGKLLRGLQGQFWIGGYRDSMAHWQWVTGEPWGYTRWGKKEGEDDSRIDPSRYLAIRGKFHGHRWVWEEKWDPKGISGFIAERDLRSLENSPVVPLPAAAWLFGSGVAALAGLGLARGKKRSMGNPPEIS